MEECNLWWHIHHGLAGRYVQQTGTAFFTIVRYLEYQVIPHIPMLIREVSAKTIGINAPHPPNLNDAGSEHFLKQARAQTSWEYEASAIHSSITSVSEGISGVNIKDQGVCESSKRGRAPLPIPPAVRRSWQVLLGGGCPLLIW